MWNQDLYLKAWNFASTVHLGQKVPGSDIPYINHIGLVAMEATAAIANNPKIGDPNLMIACALLHDSIEDTSTTYDDVSSEFGKEIADGVLALSKDEKIEIKIEQMADSLQRIKLQPKEVWMVKLCDRITNLQPPPAYWDNEKILKYRDEARFILEQLGAANLFLAERLKGKIEAYACYFTA